MPEEPVVLDEMHIVILGQSNARGSGQTSVADTGLFLTSSYAGVTLNCKLGVANTDPIVYDFTLTDVPLQPYQATGVNMGFDLSLGRYFDGTSGNGDEDTYITKMAVNGMDIETMLPGAGEPDDPQEFWLQLIEYLDARVAAIGAVDAVVWSQWENDATDQTKADNYSGNLDTLFAALRARYGNFRVFMVKAHANATGGGILSGARDTIRATQVAWCAVGANNALLIDTDDLTLQTDNIHYHEDGYVILGIRLAEAIADWNLPDRDTDRATGPTPWIQGNDMPCVTSTTTNTLTPWLPLHAAGDIINVAVISSVTSTAPTLTTANGFSPVTSTAFSTTLVMSLYTKTATAIDESDTQDSPPVFTPAGNAEQSLAIAWTVRGSSGLSGTPGVSNGSANPGTQTGLTTADPNCLVVYVAGCHSGTQSQNISAWTNSTLTGFGEVRDTRRVVSSNAELIGLGVGTLATAGATGNATITYASGTPARVCIAVAYKP